MKRVLLPEINNLVNRQGNQLSFGTGLPKVIIDQIEAFFKNYNEQAGKKFKVLTTTAD